MTVRKFENFTPRIAATAYVDETALVIGDVSIADDVSLWPQVVVRGDVNSIVIGARTNIQDGSVLHVSHDSEFAPGGFALRIGADITVGHRAILHGCTVEDRCLIGMAATVMDGAIVRSGAIVGAGSLVLDAQDGRRTQRAGTLRSGYRGDDTGAQAARRAGRPGGPLYLGDHHHRL